MRAALSCLIGLASAVLILALVEQWAALDALQLVVCGSVIAALSAASAYPSRAIKRSAIRLRNRARREWRAAQPGRAAYLHRWRILVGSRLLTLGRTFLAMLAVALDRFFALVRSGVIACRRYRRARRTDEGGRDAEPGLGARLLGPVRRVNPMWATYAAVLVWTAVEITGWRLPGAATIETAAAGASSAMQAVTQTTAAVGALRDAGKPADAAAGLTAAFVAGHSFPGTGVAATETKTPPCSGRRCGCTGLFDAFFLSSAPAKEF